MPHADLEIKSGTTRTQALHITKMATNRSGLDGRTDISFTLPKADGPTAMAALDKIKAQIKFKSLLSSTTTSARSR